MFSKRVFFFGQPCTILYGTKSIKSQAVQAWNEINNDLHHLKLQNVSRAICNRKTFEYLLEKYPGINNNTNNRYIPRNDDLNVNRNHNHNLNHNNTNNPNANNDIT